MFYFYVKGRYCIYSLEFPKSERTIDISFFDLANNEKLLNLLSLHYSTSKNKVNDHHTYETRAEAFCSYLSNNRTDLKQKILKNPTVRILIEDKELLDKIKKISLVPKIKTYYLFS